MSTYFCFSDECGDYKANITENQRQKHPFYIRTTLIINSSEWKKLNHEFKELKRKYALPPHKEIKWANLWTLRNFQINQRPIPNKYDIKFLEDYDYNKLISFVEEALSLITNLSEKKIIATYTKNSTSFATNEKSMLSFHLQEHMQRIEMELQNKDENLAVVFFDPVSNEKNELFRQIYNELFESGDFINSYKSIKDSLNIENSHHSVGIQLADFISGAFSSILKFSPKNPYTNGVTMFYNYIFPNLRCSTWNSNIHGYGIREVPRSLKTREWLKVKLEETKHSIANQG